MIKMLRPGDKVLYQEKTKGWRNTPRIATVIHAPLPTDNDLNVAIIKYVDQSGLTITKRASIRLLRKLQS